MNSKQNNKSGINLLVNEIKGESQIQGAWRFYNNENVKIDDLNNPILKEGCEQINKECKEYCLVAYDWSHIDFRNHHAKKDCIETRRSKKEAKSKGYDLQGSLAVHAGLFGHLRRLEFGHLRRLVFGQYAGIDVDSL